MLVDRDARYLEIAKERLVALFNGTLKTRPMGKPVHVPTGKEKVSQKPENWTKPKQDFLL